jgi:hypothetical protein
MGFFKKKNEPKDERPAPEPQPDTVDPAPWLGQVGDGATLESGERIAHEILELWEARRRRTNVDAAKQISSDPEMPIPNPAAEPGKKS